MKILTTIAEVRALMHSARVEGKTVGVMGTSGRMHEGHLSLVRRALQENDLAIMFWLGDLTFSWAGNVKAPGLYDRDWETDKALCATTGIEYVYMPAGDDYMARPPVCSVQVPKLITECPPMEEVDHLNQVATATLKLFNIFGKMRYYSGEKDWQQLAIFKRLAEDFSAEAEVIGCEVIREADGLAMSSRNVKLTPADREKAPQLYQALRAAKAAIEEGEVNASFIEQLLSARLDEMGETLYANAVDAINLQPMSALGGDVRLIASVKLGEVALVDNIGAVAAG